MLHILVSNDDGVHAKGIAVLAQSLRKIAKVDIVAPDRNRSGASNSLTLDVPLHIKKLAEDTISIEGTPTDCVHAAITGLLPSEPDMVVSGINERSNLGDDILYSGTVAAAMEGRFLGKPSIAVSLASGENACYYETAGEVARILVERLMVDPLPATTILNVNVPDLPFEQLQGFEVTRLGSRHRAEPIIPYKDPRGNTVYWVGLAGPTQDAGPGTDFYAIKMGKVSITPIQLDLTNYRAFEQISQWLIGLTK